MASTGVGHIASLDGIRAAAAITVFASHAFSAAYIPSSLGVTVFFFLSGFLITTLLRRELETSGRISLRHFYLRRACRIFPPMYFVLTAMLLFQLVTHGRESIDGAAVLAQYGHLTNYFIVTTGSDAGLLPYTSVLWSLAVEEHFYLVFPMLFLYLAARMPVRSIAPVLGAICALVLVWRVLVVLDNSIADQYIFYATDTRFDSLLFGCIMGVWCNPVLDAPAALEATPGFSGKAMLVFGITLLLATMLYRAPMFQKTLRYTLQGIALFPLFWLAVRYPTWVMFRWLNWKPMRWFGGISFSFYMAHPFWLHVSGNLLHGTPAALLGFVLTTLFSAALYWQLERPFLMLGHTLGSNLLPAGLKKEAT
jgi:peptidoglycan/LPS O-acetylase OafA/YrhL